MMRTQWIRIYSQQQDEHCHSFYLGHTIGGISERIVSFDIDETTTFKDLRQTICWREQNGFYRRPLVFAELLEAMKTATDKYGYSKDDILEFRFGYDNCDIDSNKKGRDLGGHISEGKEINGLPRIIQFDIEDEPIDQIIPPGVDLILVPLVLIPK